MGREKDGEREGWEERSDDLVLLNTMTNNLLLVASLLARCSVLRRCRRVGTSHWQDLMSSLQKNKDLKITNQKPFVFVYKLFG